MSHYTLKTKYIDEGPFGTEEEFILYADHNVSSDYISIYDHTGKFLLSFDDTIDNNIIKALTRLCNPFEGEGFKPGVESMTIEEKLLCKMIKDGKH